jgi:hypothetical protein
MVSEVTDPLMGYITDRCRFRGYTLILWTNRSLTLSGVRGGVRFLVRLYVIFESWASGEPAARRSWLVIGTLVPVFPCNSSDRAWMDGLGPHRAT